MAGGLSARRKFVLLANLVIAALTTASYLAMAWYFGVFDGIDPVENIFFQIFLLSELWLVAAVIATFPRGLGPPSAKTYVVVWLALASVLTFLGLATISAIDYEDLFDSDLAFGAISIGFLLFASTTVTTLVVEKLLLSKLFASDLPALVPDAETSETLVSALRARARAARTNSWFALALIFLNITAGIVVVIRAGDLISEDLQSVENRNKAELYQQALLAETENLQNSQSWLDDVETDASTLRNCSANPATQQGNLSLQCETARKNLEQGLRNAGTTLNEFAPTTARILDFYDEQRALAASSREVAEARLEEARELVSVATQLDILGTTLTRLNSTDDPAMTPNGDSVQTLIASGILRFGILALLLLLVQVLVSLYRYSMRLAAFYDSRADALVLSGGNTDGIDLGVRAMSPDMMDFGKAPGNPLNAIRDVASAAAQIRDLAVPGSSGAPGQGRSADGDGQ